MNLAAVDNTLCDEQWKHITSVELFGIENNLHRLYNVVKNHLKKKEKIDIKNCAHLMKVVVESSLCYGINCGEEFNCKNASSLWYGIVRGIMKLVEELNSFSFFFS